jgi:hypothetical protein
VEKLSMEIHWTTVKRDGELRCDVCDRREMFDTKDFKRMSDFVLRKPS